MELILTLIQLITFILYVGYIYVKYGELHSISQSWYELPQNRKWMFTLFTWTLGVTLCFLQTNLFFISGIGFCFVGAAAMFDDNDITKYTHYTGAGIGILFAFLGMTFDLKFILPIIIYAITIPIELFIIRKNVIWWIEIWAFVLLMFGFCMVYVIR